MVFQVSRCVVWSVLLGLIKIGCKYLISVVPSLMILFLQLKRYCSIFLKVVRKMVMRVYWN